MKHLFKKTITVSFASIAAVKIADHQQRNQFLFKQPSFANDEVYAQQDIIGNIIKQEFEGDLKLLPDYARNKYEFNLKTRDEHIKELIDPKTNYDILIIGGGSSGAGVALEASSRGLKCAVIDTHDFASGTSSRSTKLAHGGIRYFENMIKLKGDPFENYHLCREALHERNYFLYAAPFQNRQIDLIIPSSSLIMAALYYFPGSLLYHFMYLKQLFSSDYDVAVDGPRVLLKRNVRKLLPELKSMGKNYGVLMHETQMMDSRMNINALLTSSIDNFIIGMKGATLANYVEFQDFIKNDQGKIEGAVLFDKLKKKQYKIKSKVVVNCAGIQGDELRLKDNPQEQPRILGARGTHLMFKRGLIPENSGIIIPKTRDGRLIFIANYLGHTLVGTTDEKCDIAQYVEPPQKDVDFIIGELKYLLGDDINYETELQSAWAGIRPLVKSLEHEHTISQEEINRLTLSQKVGRKIKDGIMWVSGKLYSDSAATAAISRNHVIEESKSGLISLMGGKWTTFRAMGQEVVDKIIKENKPRIEPKVEASQTRKFRFIGSYSKVETQHGLKQGFDKIQEQYEDYFVYHYDIPRDVSKHLLHSYGTAALRVVKLGKEMNLNHRVHPDYPFSKAEIAYVARYEMAEKPNDILCRRVPIALLNKKLALEILPEIIEILGKEKKWSASQKKQELEQAIHDLQFMK